MEDENFGGTKKLIKYFISQVDYKSYYFRVKKIENKEIDDEEIYIFDIDDPSYNNIKKIINNKIIKHNKIYDLNDGSFLNKLKKYMNTYCCVILSHETIMKMKNEGYDDDMRFICEMNDNNTLEFIKNNFLRFEFILSRHELRLHRIFGTLYDYCYLRKYIPYCIDYSNKTYYIINRDYKYIGSEQKAIINDNQFEREYLFNDGSTCWTRNEKINNECIKKIIEKYMEIINNRKCLNPDENTNKLMSL